MRKRTFNNIVSKLTYLFILLLPILFCFINSISSLGNTTIGRYDITKALNDELVSFCSPFEINDKSLAIDKNDFVCNTVFSFFSFINTTNVISFRNNTYIVFSCSNQFCRTIALYFVYIIKITMLYLFMLVILFIPRLCIKVINKYSYD